MRRMGINSANLPLWLRAPLRRVLEKTTDLYSSKSYSQEGEDMILKRIFERKAGPGFYVDVGAHHPKRYSNTYYFYRRGWRGINIEPNPDALRSFRAARRGDINLQLGVADEPGSLKYYSFDEPALNTFDEGILQSRLVGSSYRLITTTDVRVERLGEILGKHLPTGQPIDFLSIDVEGLDLRVLMSNDWDRFKPECVLVEALGVSIERVKESDVYLLMRRHGYVWIAKTFNTLVFRREAVQA